MIFGFNNIIKSQKCVWLMIKLNYFCSTVFDKYDVYYIFSSPSLILYEGLKVNLLGKFFYCLNNKDKCWNKSKKNPETLSIWSEYKLLNTDIRCQIGIYFKV